VDRNHARWALLRCCDCGRTFRDHLPPLDVAMPSCPRCFRGPVQLIEPLEPPRFRR